MFEKVVLRKSVNGGPVTAGELAEALLFYQKVHLLIDDGSFSHIVSAIGAGNLLRLIKEGYLSVTYLDGLLCTAEVGKYGDNPVFCVDSIGYRGTSKDNSVEDVMREFLHRTGLSERSSRNYAKEFKRRFSFTALNSDYYVNGGILHTASNSLLDTSYVSAAANRYVREITMPTNEELDLGFKINFLDEKNFTISSNFDLQRETTRIKLNERYKIDVGHIINQIIHAQSELILCSHYGGDFHLPSISSDLVMMKSQSILKSTINSNRQLSAFKEMIFTGSKDISQVINSRERAFHEFMPLLKKAKKFKKWITDINPDEKICHEYVQDISSVGWLEGTSSKSTRLCIGMAWDSLEPISGKIFAVIDALILERLAGGWKPNIFVNDKLKKFTEK